MLDELPLHVGVLVLEFHIPEAQSLKQKRRVIKSFKDRVRARFNASVAEISELDKWQRSICGISMISNDQDQIDGCFKSVLQMLISMPGLVLIKSYYDFI